MYELAGDLLYKLQQPEVAISLYRKGGAFPRAIELARNVSPEEVINLEEEWGDWYVCTLTMCGEKIYYLCYFIYTLNEKKKLPM